MKQKVIPILFMCFSLIFLPGCKDASSKKALCRVVTQVDITGREKDVEIHRRYTDTQKMQWVLIYLRTLNPGIKPQSPPETALAETYEISLKFSDGSEKIYRQADHRFLSQDFHPWQSIEPGRASGLYTLMRKLPSDENFADTKEIFS